MEDDESDVEPCEPDVESDDEPDADDEDVEPESDGSASATPGVFAITAPTPSATANAPTRPMYFAVPTVVPSPGESGADSPSKAPVSRMVRGWTIDCLYGAAVSSSICCDPGVSNTPLRRAIPHPNE